MQVNITLFGKKGRGAFVRAGPFVRINTVVSDYATVFVRFRGFFTLQN